MPSEIRGSSNFDSDSVGKVLQVVHIASTTTQSTTSSSWQNSNLTLSITPSSTSSKILLSYHNGTYHNTNNSRTNTTLFRGDNTGTNLGHSGAGFGSTAVSSGNIRAFHSGVFLDSPSTTAAQIYTMCYKATLGGAAYVQVDSAKGVLVAMEIGA